ncbi:MAG: ornithine carbamoyltransferase [Candidatus Pelagibacter sp. TMED275]|nr:MAG: ornithine carbamoyltransferase [Candidatus Pelagibacter sp. TMED275]|tara:strand:+ start:2928 stop:3863 length:936 start_codon:yes stop_codon:yes gene_type:complete
MNNFINLKDISYIDLRKIIKDSKARKKYRKYLGSLDLDKDAPLKGKLLIQMFEKSSLRTRLSFYLAMRQLGGGVHNLRKEELHLGQGGETIKDTAKIISIHGDIFMLRTDSEQKIREFKNNLDIPLINGLSPESHPAQVLSDIFTIEEIKKKKISNLKVCWIGDCNNVLNSLIEASIKFAFKLSIASPKKYQPKNSIIKLINSNKKLISIFINPNKAILNADVVMTDKFVSLNDKVNQKKKKKDFKGYQVNKELIKSAKKDFIFLHCLPANRGEEVSREVIDGKNSVVWQQAANRFHVQKSILLYCFKKLR